MKDLKDYIQSSNYKLSRENLEKIVHYQKLVQEGNEKQNLTRLLNDSDFFYGHLVDCFEYSKQLVGSTMNYLDLGSGCGVPGVVCAILNLNTNWVLTESEESKREFLREVVKKLELSNVQVARGRAEEFLGHTSNKNYVVVSRAVATVEKIYSWIENCSTWNSIVLFKGRSWESEYADFTKKDELKVASLHKYITKTKTGEEKQSLLIHLERSL